MFFPTTQEISFPRLILVDRSMTVKDLKFEIFKHLRPLIKDPGLKASGVYKSPEEKLMEDYLYFFESKNMKWGSMESGNALYSIEIFNNLHTTEGIFYGSSQQNCEFCDNKHMGTNCPFYFKDNVTMRTILGKIKDQRDLELAVVWNSSAFADLTPITNIKYDEMDLTEHQEEMTKTTPTKDPDAISLYDCLKLFNQDETL